jgi:FecR protein
MNFTPKVPLNASGEYLQPGELAQLQRDPNGSDSLSFHSLSDGGHVGLVKVPDAHLLFSGDYTRSGNDLIISDHLHRYVLPDYFAGEKRPMLVSPEGAAIDHRFVEALTGHLQYAQAGTVDPAVKIVGHVVKMAGSSSIIRNGVAIIANTGDTLYQTDVVQTGSNSTVGLVLDDGTAFNLVANTRFMLNELDFDPAGSSNHSLVSLLQGAASFVAGQVAKTGDMEVSTPVATIGIRGTAVLLDINSTDGHVSISVADQQDQSVHSVQVFRCVPTGLQGVCGAGDLIGTVASDGPSLSLTPTGNFNVTTQEISKAPDQVTQEFSSFQQLLSTYDAGKQLYPNLPQHTENTNTNSNTGTTKTALGSTPVLPSEPPSTTVFTDASSTKVAGSLASTVSLNITSESPTGAGSTASTTSLSDSSPVSTFLPAVSPLVISNAGGTINLKSVVITGTADPGTTVTLLDTFKGSTTQIGTATAGAGGEWTANITLEGEGVNTVVAQDSNGTIASSPVVFTLDSVPPNVAIISSGGTTRQAAQTISGTVAAAAGEAAVGATVTLFDTVNGVTTQLGLAAVGAGGNWSATVTLSGNGVHSIVAVDTDAAGNTGTSAPVTFDLAALLTVTIAAVEGNNVINHTEALAP